jgi:hypothetical protein
MSQPVRNHVFVSYSHADEEYLKRLRVHLGLLERRNIKIWTDKDIAPGMKWQDEIKDALSRTKVAVLMISTDFLSSDFITKQELPPLLAAAQSEGVEILPVIVKPSAFGDIEVEPLSCYQAVNMGRPLVKLKDDAEREEEFVRILQLIRKHMEGAPRPPATAPPPRAAAVGQQPAGMDLAGPEASPDDNYDDPEEAEAEPQPLPLEIALGADLEAMLADPLAQALAIQAVTDAGGVDLMLVTEGRDGTVLLEVLGNDELPPGFKMNRDAQRHLVEQLGLNPPEIRGDRFFGVYGADGEDVNLDELIGVIVLALADVFGVPGEDADVAWQVLEQ